MKVVEKQAQRRIFKIIVIGDSNVGKTCLTYRFCLGKFPDKTEATIGVDFREKSVQVGSEQLKVSSPLFSSFVYRTLHWSHEARAVSVCYTAIVLLVPKSHWTCKQTCIAMVTSMCVSHSVTVLSLCVYFCL